MITCVKMSLSEIFSCIKVVKDFPKYGIIFRHIGPLLKNTKLFKYTMNQLINVVGDYYDVVCGLDARGFIISSSIQMLTGIPQVMIRKQSKLPGPKFSHEYKKEYGSDILELEADSITPGQRVLIVDDLMATAGTLNAAINLVEQAGGIVCGVAVLVEFRDLKGRDKIKNYKVFSLFSLDSFNDTEVLNNTVDIPNKLKLNKFRPTVYPINDDRPVLMWHTSMESFAKKMLTVSNFRPSYINWNYFPDNWPNITFEPSSTLINKDITFIMSMSNKEIFAEQLAMLVVLPRQLINSLTIIIPYLGPATHERVDYSGQLATVEPILKIMSSCIPMTKTGPPIFRIFDIHALQIRFYPNDNITMKLMSAIPVLLSYLKNKNENYVIVYPDDGSHKRFKYFFEDFPQVICSKIRDGDTRKIIIREKINWPEDAINNCIIIDDLAQSGETLLSCAKSLKNLGFTNVSAFVTHAIFPNDTWKKFTQCDIIDKFIITNTNPTISDKLHGIKPFTILDIQSYLCKELSINNPKIILENRKNVNIYVATTNIDKLNAVYESSLNGRGIYYNKCCVYEIHSVEGISSGVSEQPLSLKETILGAENRLKKCIDIANFDTESTVYISVENGIMQKEDGHYYDMPVTGFKINNEKMTFIYNNSSSVKIPEEYLKYINTSGEVTFGSIIEKKIGKKDWHKYISGTSRKDLIVRSISF